MKPLRLLQLREAPDSDIREFRASSPWVTMLLMGIVVGLCLWVGLRGGIYFGEGGALPAFIAWWIVFWLGLFWLMLVNLCLKSRQPSAWLVRADSQGLYIKWRSYQNVAWQTEGPQVLYVPYANIAEARRHKRHWNTPESRQGGNREVRNTFLELQLRNTDTTELARRLADERAGHPDGKKIPQGRWGHYPVALEPNDLLRIEWRASPGIKAMLALLRERGVSIASPMRSANDLTSQAGEADLQELARQGDLMTMIRVMRANSDISLEEARAKAKAMIADKLNTAPKHD
ncbi:MAG: hypothetical protein WA056_14310 [Gallionella sp.]